MSTVQEKAFNKELKKEYIKLVKRLTKKYTTFTNNVENPLGRYDSDYMDLTDDLRELIEKDFNNEDRDQEESRPPIYYDPVTKRATSRKISKKVKISSSRRKKKS